MMNILVLCTGNSCRSQMADGYLKEFSPLGTNVYSAGIETHGVNPYAIASLQRDRVDISKNTSNHVDEYEKVDFDFVITVCDNAKESCPVFPSKAIKFHCNFPDPGKFEGTDKELGERFDEVRDMVKAYCKSFTSAYL